MKKSMIAAAALLTMAAAAQAEDLVVKMGLTGPLSGANAFAGKDNQNGVQMAVDEANAKKIQIGGKTLKLELKSEDDQCDPKTGVSVAQRFVDSGVKFVLGPYCSGVAIPASKVYDEGKALMSTVGTNPQVTTGGYPGVFRIVAADDLIGPGMARFAHDKMKVKTAAVMDDRTAFGQGLADQFAKEAKALGINVVAREYTTDKATDFNAVLTKLKGKAPDVIFYGGYATQAGPMARQMKGLGLTAKLLGGDTLCVPEVGKLAGDAANDTVFCAQGGAVMDKSSAFAAAYKKKFNQDPDAYAASFYDQALFIVQQMQKTQSVDPAKVGASMKTDSYKGVVTTYGYDDKGNLKNAPVTVYTFKNGTLAPVR